MIASSTLAHYKKMIGWLLTDTCTIEAEQDGVDEYGGATRVWQTVASGVACRFIRAGTAGPMSDLAQSMETMREYFRVVLPVGTAVDVDQRITRTSTGEVYHVSSIDEALTDAVCIQVLAARQR